MNIKQENILALIGLVILGAVIFAAFLIGLNKAEKLECLKWQKEAGEYPDYFLTDWQKEQCEHRGIEIKL